jgi:hypothetical protein
VSGWPQTSGRMLPLDMLEERTDAWIATQQH